MQLVKQSCLLLLFSNAPRPTLRMESFLVGQNLRHYQKCTKLLPNGLRILTETVIFSTPSVLNTETQIVQSRNKIENASRTIERTRRIWTSEMLRAFIHGNSDSFASVCIQRPIPKARDPSEIENAPGSLMSGQKSGSHGEGRERRKKRNKWHIDV
jgi:hypothetical protein